MTGKVLAAAALGIAAAMMLRAYSQSAQVPATAPGVADFAQAQRLFGTSCSGCHGAGGLGGDRAPSLIDNPQLRRLSAAEIAGIIKGGTPKGMPPFSRMPDDQVAKLANWLHSRNLPTLTVSPASQVAAGEKFFFAEGGCSTCHMVHGHGGSNGPDLSAAGLEADIADEITKMLNDPTSQMGSKTHA